MKNKRRQLLILNGPKDKDDVGFFGACKVCTLISVSVGQCQTHWVTWLAEVIVHCSGTVYVGLTC